MVKDEVLDEDEQLEANEENINEFLDHNIMETDRNKLGIVVNHLSKRNRLIIYLHTILLYLVLYLQNIWTKNI